jgi:uncharacterized protein YxjI
MKKTILCLGIGFAALTAAFSAAAQKTEPIFEISAGNAVNNAKFLIQASTGELIAGNELKLFAIDPEKKTVIWENNDFLGLDEDDITVIEGTPFIKIERQKTLSLSKNKNTYIIQARDGKIVYDSKGEGIKVRSTLILPQLGGLLIESIKDGFLSVSFVDFATAKELWTVPLAKEKTGGIGIGAIRRKINSFIVSAFDVAPIVDANKNLVLINKKEVFCINKAGTLAWKKEYDETVDDAYLGADGKSIFIGYKKYIDKLTTENGNSALAEPVKMRDALNGISPMGSNYLVYNEAGINIMDAAGNMKWKKDSKLGNITQVKYTANGILAIEAVKDDETIFYWVNNEGKEMWNQKVDGGLILAEPTDKGVMYVTSERANTLTYEKGKDVWNKDIKIKGTPNFGVDAKSKILYAFAKEKVHAFNFNDNTYRLIAEGVELKKFDDEKEPVKLDIRNEGSLLVISTNQNVASIQTSDGKINYNNYFKDIGNSRKKLMRFAGAAMGVAGAAMDVSAISKGNFNLTQTVDKDNNPVANSYTVNANDPTGQAISGAGSDLYAAAKGRYMASQATKDNLYILSEMPEGNGMLVWNKNKGEITKKITFSDTTPKFVVDESVDRVYVIVGNVIKAYDLK